MHETRQLKPPPDWLPEVHSAADLGEYLRCCETLCRCSIDPFVIQCRFGYHFPHPKQEEDILTEMNVNVADDFGYVCLDKGKRELVNVVDTSKHNAETSHAQRLRQ